MKGERGKMKNRGIYGSKKRGRKWWLILWWEEGKRVFAVVFSLMKTTEFLNIKREQQRRFGQRHEAFKSLQEPTLFAIKFVPWRIQKIIYPTFGIIKFHRWLTVATLGDGAFLKASRTSNLLSPGGWPVPHPLGCPSFLQWFSFALKTY